MKKGIKYTFITVFMAGAFTLVFLMATVPNISAFEYLPQKFASVISADNFQIGSIRQKNATHVSFEKIPKDLINAVVAIEDKRYFKHFGIDVWGIGRAFVTDIINGDFVEGASTITQQTATLLFFNKEKLYIRKLREAVTAILLERKYAKNEIITMYLNEVYFGAGTYGIYEASEAYFSKTPSELTLEECAMLAGIIQAPSAYNPLTEDGYNYAMKRKEKTLRLMAEQGFISDDAKEKAIAAEITIKKGQSYSFDHGKCEEGTSAYMNNLFNQALEILKGYCHEQLGLSFEASADKASELIYGDLKIYATMSYLTQREAYSSAKDQIKGKEGDPNAAFVFLKSTNGDVIAYYGSNTYIDMAKAPRQPGSTIKPLYMSYDLENGLADRNTVVNDEKFDYEGYSPNNNGQFYGYVTLRETLAQSLNAASLRFFSMAPIDKIVDFVKTFGISTIVSKDYTPAFALGGLTNGIKPIEMAQAYGAFANGGKVYEANFIDRIEFSDGEVIYPTRKAPKKAISESTSVQIKSCLESTIIRGTGQLAKTGYSTMGKTGTTDNNRDVWFAGSTGDIVAAVWCGNIDYGRVPDLSTSWCMSIFKNTILEAISNKTISDTKLSPPREEPMTKIDISIKEKTDKTKPVDVSEIVTVSVPVIEKPSFASREVVSVDICSSSGLLFNALNCPASTKSKAYFVRDSQPKEFCRRLVHSQR